MYYGRDVMIETKRSRHWAEIAEGMLELPSRPLVEDDVDLDIWRCRYYVERLYVESLCSLPAETLTS